MSGVHAARLRCPTCGNPDWHDRAPAEECTHCGLVVADADGLAEAAAAIPARLAAGEARGRAGDRWRMTPPAWRNAAWARGYRLDGARARPAARVPHGIALAVMASVAELPAAAALVRAVGDRFARVLVAIDAEGVPADHGLPPAATILAHPLARDFAAQRNRLQAAAGGGWVLQLDCDEAPEPALLDALGWLVAAADHDRLVSLGLPRRNLVDGRPSALWPDIQYRLNRAEVRFSGIVHERPVAAFERTSLALPGAILHRLSAARVVARTRAYGALAPDGARACDEARLLRPFDAIAEA